MSRSRSLLPALRLAAGSVASLGAAETSLVLRQAACLRLICMDAASPLSAAAAALRLPASSQHGTSFAARPLSSSSAAQQQQQQQSQQGGRKRGGSKTTVGDGGLVSAEEEFSAITDKIPQRPVSVAEGTSYTVVIIAALGFAAAVMYAALNELFFSPKEYQCYSHTLEKIKDDPRVTVRLGSPVSAYGTESRNRAARQRIPHRIYNDSEGREHIQLQFHMRGPSGRATVNADMYSESGSWKYHFLYLDVQSPLQQQVVLVRPGQGEGF